MERFIIVLVTDGLTGITVTQLARLSEVKQSTLHGWTTGRSVKNIDDLKKVCSVLEIGIHDLIFGISDPHGEKNPNFEKTLNGEIRITISHTSKKDSHE